MAFVTPWKWRGASASGSSAQEGPALGGAMLAAVGCGEYPDVKTIAQKIVKVIDTVEPEEELVKKYEEKYQKFRRIYPTVKCLY